jgi:TonB family protein
MLDRQPGSCVADPMSHRWLIAVSMGAHFAVAGALFATGVWRIDRMENHNRSRAEILQPPPPPAPSGSPVAVKLPDLPPKVKPPEIVKSVVQLPTERPQVGAAIPSTEPGGGGGSGNPDDPGMCKEHCGEAAQAPAVPVCGDGSLDASEQCDDGNKLDGDGCSSTCRIEVKPKPALQQIAPKVLSGLRMSGETQVHPGNSTQSQMVRDVATRVVGTVKLCISSDGGVSSAKMLVSTKYDAYDAALLAAVHDWHYRPYTINGAAVPACSSVTFVYSIN